MTMAAVGSGSEPLQHRQEDTAGTTAGNRRAPRPAASIRLGPTLVGAPRSWVVTR